MQATSRHWPTSDVATSDIVNDPFSPSILLPRPPSLLPHCSYHATGILDLTTLTPTCKSSAVGLDLAVGWLCDGLGEPPFLLAQTPTPPSGVCRTCTHYSRHGHPHTCTIPYPLLTIVQYPAPCSLSHSDLMDSALLPESTECAHYTWGMATLTLTILCQTCAHSTTIPAHHQHPPHPPTPA